MIPLPTGEPWDPKHPERGPWYQRIVWSNPPPYGDIEVAATVQSDGYVELFWME